MGWTTTVLAPGLRVVALAAAAVLTMGAAPPSAPVAAGSLEQTRYYWRWSDGSQDRERIFRQARFRVPERLPTLVVSTYPARTDVLVLLQFRTGGRWQTEDQGRTDRAGQVRLHLNPYCDDGRWCARTLAYRATAGGETTSLSVRFAP